MRTPGRSETHEAAVQPAGNRVDSRQYIFSFPIESLSAIPADFTGLPDFGALRAGVFLPRDDPDWLGRGDYPARVLLLTERDVVVAAHPAEREPLLQVAAGRIQSVECGRMLLPGWIVIAWDGGRIRLLYNMRTEGPVARYLRTFKDQWLPAAPVRESQRCEAVGEPLNLKFEYARIAELLPGETALVQLFHPARRHLRGSWVLRREHWLAGDLLMVTNRRVLWITDRYNGRYECYGTTSLSAPLESIADVNSSAADLGEELKISFCSGHSWHIPVGAIEERQTRKFEVATWRVLNAIGRTRN
jgi:hypothetical protein